MIRVTLLAALMLAVAGPAVAQVDVNQGGQLLKALRESNGSQARALVEEHGKALVNYRDADGDSAIHIVIRARNDDWTGFLLSVGADPNLPGRDGDTPLIEAARMGWRQGLVRLMFARADPNKPNRRGETPLIVAVQQRQPQAVTLLLRYGADPDRKDYSAGFSARDYARRDNRTPQLLQLIETVKRPTRAAGPTR
jgi:ankyrin repeat protein